MTNPSIWTPGEAISANSSRKCQWFTAAAGQTVFTLTNFTYAVGTGAIAVTVSGVEQRPGTDFTEISSNAIELTSPVEETGTTVLVEAFVEVTGNPQTIADASTVTYSTGTVKGALDVRLPEFGNYAALSAYVGQLLPGVYVRGAVAVFDGGHGIFRPTSDTPASANGIYRQDGAGRWWKREFLGAASPRWFGAVGDGVADDTAAVRASILSGLPIDWGNSKYLVTGEINETITHRIDWKSDGATIFYSPDSSKQSVIRLKVSPHRHRIDGVFNIDANRKAFTGFWLLSEADTIGTFPDGYPDIDAPDISVTRIYRASTMFSGGDCIRIEGGWNRVNLERARAVDAKMAAGAQILGVEGVFGISIIRIGSSTAVTAHDVNLRNIFVDGVWSEDASYQSDQDGVRVLMSYNAAGSNSTEYSFDIGGTIRNCRNRSVKSQAHLGRVRGLKVVRSASVGGLDVGLVPDIDAQVGSISVTDLEFIYDTKTPRCVIGQTMRSDNQNIPSSVVANVKGAIINNESMLSFIDVAHESGAISDFHIGVSNISVEGGILRFARLYAYNTAPNLGATFNASGVSVNLSGADGFINAPTGTGKINVNLVGCRNTNPAARDIFNDSNPASDRVCSTLNCQNFVDYKSVSPSTQGAITRVTALAPATGVECGYIRPVSFALGQDESALLPISSVGGTASNVLVVSVSHATNGAQAVFSAANSGVVKMTTTSTSWEVGTTAEPATGSYRIWIDGASGIRISNRTATRRIFTVLMVG